MFIEILENNRDKDWEDFLQTTSNGTFFHSLKWRKVIQQSFPHSALYLTIKDKNGTLVGICPGFIQNALHMKFYNSLPYSDYGGPIIVKGHKQASFSLLSFLENYCSNNNISYAKICFINDILIQYFCARATPIRYVSKQRGVMEIDLKATPSDFIWNKIFSKNRRYKIRRIEREGFQVREAVSRSDLRDFYNLYYMNLKYIHASPYPFKIIENMWRILYPENLRIWLVGKEKEIGGIAIFKYGLKTYCHLAGIDRNYNRYSIIPCLLWKEIRTAEEEGMRYVSLGAAIRDPKSFYYIQKKSFGSSFYQQKKLWYPLSFVGHIFIQSVRAYNIIRNYMPERVNARFWQHLSKPFRAF